MTNPKRAAGGTATPTAWRSWRFAASAVSSPSAASSVSSASRWRRLATRSAALLALAALGLTGCQAVPESGPVRAGLPDLQQGGDDPVQFTPIGPIDGATPEEVVRGFTMAASSSSEDYAVAREFLTADYATQWDPYAGALIDEGSRPFAETDDGVGLLSLSAAATVDQHGALTLATPGPTTDVRFELEEQGGEWRISSAPTGVILEMPTFAASWKAYELFFYDQRGRLVPEYRWFLDRPTVATQIVGELGNGPTEAYRGPLSTALPAGAQLSSGSVTVVDGTADVSLVLDDANISDAAVERIKKQLAASLEAVSGVTHVSLSIGDVQVDEFRVGREDDDGGESAGVSVLIGDEFGTLTGNDLDARGELNEGIAALSPDAVTLARGSDGAAVQHAGEVAWVNSAGEATVLDERTGQLEPSIDPYSYVWTYSNSADDPGLAAHLPGEESVALEAPWLAGYTPEAIRLSPSGTRIAALVEEEGRSVVLVAPVERGEDGSPTGVGDRAVTGMWTTGEPLDLDWIDERTFTSLSKVRESSKVTLGGPGVFPIEVGSVPNGVKLSGGGARSLLRVLDDRGELFAQQGSGWQRQENGIDLLAKHG